MRNVFTVLLLAAAIPAQTASQLAPDDAVRIREFFRMASQSQIQDHIWPTWSQTPASLLLVTTEAEFLARFPVMPEGFTKTSEGLYVRPRRFPINFQATFPAFGPPAVIVIGQPANTETKSSTPWLFTVMHEHFHQLQYGKPGYQLAVDRLGLSGGDKTGMWMLNYTFPYDKPGVAQAFARLRDLLLGALNESNNAEFSVLAKVYVAERKKFFSLASPEDRKYFSFQLWQEGIARYTQIKAAETAATYQPSAEFAALPDYESFRAYAGRARSDTLAELKAADLAKWKRVVVYSFGGTEGLLLDRLHPEWKKDYFKHLLSTESLFEK